MDNQNNQLPDNQNLIQTTNETNNPNSELTIDTGFQQTVEQPQPPIETTNLNNSTPTGQNNQKKNNKLLIIIIIVVAVLIIGGIGIFACTKLLSNNNSSESANNSSNGSKTSNEKIDIYTGEKIYDIPMGAAEDGVYKKLCTVKMGSDLVVAGYAYNTSGDEQKIDKSFTAPFLKDAYNEIDFNTYFASFVAASHMTKDISMSFSTISLKFDGMNNWNDNVDYYKKSKNKYYEIGNTDHPALIIEHDSTSIWPYFLLYKLDDEWALVINYSGEFEKKLSQKEIGEVLYNLITPV